MANGQLTSKHVHEMFAYHKPSEEQVKLMEPLREKARELALVIHENCPNSADTSAALRKLRECVMTANASIVLHGKI